jgi:hypothetical protein
METLQDFATAVIKMVDSNDIYDLFEFNTPDALRDEIFKLAPDWSDEPVREAMIKLGYMFHVETLINF